MFRPFRGRPAPSLEAQLRMLVACGVRLSPGHTLTTALDAALQESSRSELQSAPYRGLMFALATEEEPIAENLWHFAPRRITGPESYVAIVARLADMADGGLPVQDVSAVAEADQIKLSFVLDDEPREIVCAVREDWVDFLPLRVVSELTEARGSSRRFFFLDHHDGLLLACLTAEQRSRLGRETGVELEWFDVLA